MYRHLIRNSLIYIPAKEYKKYTQSLKKVYGVANFKGVEAAFENLKKEYATYPGAIDV